MKDKGLDQLFDRITTNPATWREDGLLVVRRRVDPEGEQHSCKVGCSPNMCKGEELSAFLKEHGEYEKVVYIGDGSNDFCPVVRLRESVIAHFTNTTILTSPFFQTGYGAGSHRQGTTEANYEGRRERGSQM
jgi:Putative Phosphatase